MMLQLDKVHSTQVVPCCATPGGGSGEGVGQVGTIKVG